MHQPLAFDGKRFTPLERQRAAKTLIYPFTHVYTARNTRGLHSACRVHRVTPEIVGKLDLPDDAGNNRADVNADTNLKA